MKVTLHQAICFTGQKYWLQCLWCLSSIPESTHGETVIVIGNEHGDMGSKPGCGCLHFT